MLRAGRRGDREGPEETARRDGVCDLGSPMLISSVQHASAARSRRWLSVDPVGYLRADHKAPLAVLGGARVLFQRSTLIAALAGEGEVLLRAEVERGLKPDEIGQIGALTASLCRDRGGPIDALLVAATRAVLGSRR